MTVAVCIKCGAMKRGALTHCFECDFHPQEHEDMGKAMVLTDHFLSRGELEAVSAQIKSGQEVSYPEDAVRGYCEMFEQMPSVELSPKMDRFIFLFGFLFVLLGGLFVSWILR